MTEDEIYAEAVDAVKAKAEICPDCYRNQSVLGWHLCPYHDGYETGYIDAASQAAAAVREVTQVAARLRDAVVDAHDVIPWCDCRNGGACETRALLADPAVIALPQPEGAPDHV